MASKKQVDNGSGSMSNSVEDRLERLEREVKKVHESLSGGFGRLEAMIKEIEKSIVDPAKVKLPSHAHSTVPFERKGEELIYDIHASDVDNKK